MSPNKVNLIDYFNMNKKTHYLWILLMLITNVRGLQASNIARLEWEKTENDSNKRPLPFAIAKEKKLPADELADKKEGVYVTGVPDFSSDPVNGVGYGGEGTVYFNGKRSDPFFEYTAYRGVITFALFNTTKKQRECTVDWDIPYIFDTKWRLRGELAFEVNPNLLYFGIDESETMKGLSYLDSSNGQLNLHSNVNYHQYEASLKGDNLFYNTYTKQESILNVSAEHSYREGRLRFLVGYEYAKLKLSPFTGNSLLQNDFNSGKILGVGKNTVSFLQLGLIYDTRDLETDPSHGKFAELTNELSLKAFGSQYNFNKTFTHFNYYKKVWPHTFKKMVFASRMAMGYTAGNSPFYEYQDQWSSEGSIEGLGGGQTIRGYKQSRFLGRVMQFNNIELRVRLAQKKFLKQSFAFSAVPFYDLGAVWDSFSSISKELNNYRQSEGLGLRIVWNVNTILRLDYAVSKEDQQFFFQLKQTF